MPEEYALVKITLVCNQHMYSLHTEAGSNSVRRLAEQHSRHSLWNGFDAGGDVT